MSNSRSEQAAGCIYSVADVRAIDRRAIESVVGGYELMTRAGQFACSVAQAGYPEARRWQILCGAGNNAGDGYVVARLARAAGIDVRVSCVAAPDSLAGDARTAWQDAVAAGVPISVFETALDPDAELLVDALLGSGLTRAVDGRYADAVHAMNTHPAPVVSLDLPTGLHGDSGAVLGCAVHAAMTVTFVGRKAGLYLQSGPDVCGHIRFSALELPASCYADSVPVMRLLDAAAVSGLLPRRSRQAHKGVFGHVLVVGGGPGMPGAARLAGEAALRGGAGRVSVAAHPDSAAAIPAARPELMCLGVADAAALGPLLAGANVVALGPGLGRGEWSRSLFDTVVRSSLPLVVDADALALLAGTPAGRAARILTPHPGEAGTLLGCSASDVQADRPAALEALQARYGGTIVLKGCGTLVSADDGAPPWLCTAGNPGMASAGMGDVLTGLVAGLLAQGLAPGDAARLAVYAHGRAGDVAAAGGERGLLASELLAEVRPWLNA